MMIGGWTEQANSDYFELFGVDKEKEAAKMGKAPVSTTWEPTHRLDSFYWDEACEYPLPPESADDEEEASTISTTGTKNFDQCSSLFRKFMVQEYKMMAAMRDLDNKTNKKWTHV
jgi:hypothetical protein